MFKKIMFVGVLISVLLFSVREADARGYFSLNEHGEPKTKKDPMVDTKTALDTSGEDLDAAVDSDTVTVIYPDREHAEAAYIDSTEAVSADYEKQSVSSIHLELILQIICIIGAVALASVIFVRIRTDHG